MLEQWNSVGGTVNSETVIVEQWNGDGGTVLGEPGWWNQ